MPMCGARACWEFAAAKPNAGRFIEDPQGLRTCRARRGGPGCLDVRNPHGTGQDPDPRHRKTTPRPPPQIDANENPQSARPWGPIAPPRLANIKRVCQTGQGSRRRQRSAVLSAWLFTNDAFRQRVVHQLGLAAVPNRLQSSTRRRHASMRWPTTWKHIWTCLRCWRSARAVAIMHT